ncbi:NADPH2:quinone reductase [Micromonospora citrea]|uniref:NADPH2:quinone reductase n=1 Tax=Micromonospora citrea TaxID=47855 RepID=A0A1C6UQH9_9ACTN|nr:zinc-binding dehydrogenase [Micromonospora citrea]SCL56272.1 NADPH2:quinone reductase [Micromonospora citrea]
MRAIQLHEFGPPENLVLGEVPDLSPGPGQVRIAVSASGVHLLDTSLRRGEAGGPMPPPELPTIPGREVAGVVDDLGEGVDESWRGRRVVAHLGMVPGGYAEQAVTAVESLHVVPPSLGCAEAVAAVGTGRTALGVFDLEPPAAGDVVFVPSAAGGVGWLLVQAARTTGATVVAAARGAGRTARLHELGADLVVDYGLPDWADRVREQVGGLSLVYDGVGGAVGRSALELMKPGGRFMMFGWSAGEATRIGTDDVVASGLTVGWLGQRMRALPGGIPALAARSVELAGKGWWRPLVTTYPLADAATAHADLEGRRALGKVVLTVER